MKYLFILISVLFSSVTFAQSFQNLLVVNEENTPIVNASVFGFGEELVTNENGLVRLTIEKFPIELLILKEGYLSKKIRVKNNSKKTIKTTLTRIEVSLNEITVSGEKITNDETNNQSIIFENELFNSTEINISNVLKDESGVSISKTGATIAKPIINGLSGERVAVIKNNMKVASHNWSHYHGLELDANSVEKIRIVKGANSLRYGNGALGGTVIIEDKDIFNYKKGVSGILKVGAHSNSKGLHTNTKIGGQSNHLPIFWEAKASYNKFGTYKTPKYYLMNTGHSTNNIGLRFGANYKKLKAIGSISNYNHELGIFTGSRIANQDDLKRLINLGKPNTVNNFSYTIESPKQTIHYNTYSGEIFYELKENFSITNQYSYQSNQRKEFEIRRSNRGVPVKDASLSVHSNETTLEYNTVNIHMEGGFKLNKKNYENIPGTGVVPEMPNFLQNETSSFILAQYIGDRSILEAGIRYDRSNLNVRGLDLFGNDYGTRKNYDAFSYQVGAKYDVQENLSLSLNSGLAWRLPNPFELYARGINHGSAIYIVGNEHLNVEKGFKTNGLLTFQDNFGILKANLFYQPIEDYIYTRYSNQTVQRFSGVFPVFETLQNKVTLSGGSLEFESPEVSHFKLNSMISIVNGKVKHNNTYLPQIPPTEVLTTLNYRIPQDKMLKELILKHDFSFQKRNYSEENEFLPNPPNSFSVFNISAHSEIPISKKKLNVQIEVSNLLNEEYSIYTDTFRYFSNQPGRNFRISCFYKF